MARPAPISTTQLQVGDIVQASAARGTFTLRPGDGPVVLLSAGIGVTPVLAMLHALAAEASTREVWWLYGARNGREHPFAEETRDLLEALAHGHGHICYSAPIPGSAQCRFRRRRAPRHCACSRSSTCRAMAISTSADRPAFMSDLTTGLARSASPGPHSHRDLRRGTVQHPGHCRSPPPAAAPAGRIAPARERSSRSRGAVSRSAGSRFRKLLELAEACDVPVRWSCRTGVCHNCESGLVAGTVRYGRNRSMRRRTAMC